jgi:hypothetical protein
MRYLFVASSTGDYNILMILFTGCGFVSAIAASSNKRIPRKEWFKYYELLKRTSATVGKKER